MWEFLYAWELLFRISKDEQKKEEFAMNEFMIFCFIVWIYLLWVFKRGNLEFFKFVFGSVGLFVFMMFWIQPIVTAPIARIVAAVSGVLGKLTGMFESYYQYGLLFINRSSGALSLYIDYECSGIIEIMAFTSLLWFFSVYNFVEKVIINLSGILWIFAANVLRIFIICLVVYIFGNNAFYFAHTILGRLVFYGLSILLYYYVFTRSQIIRQKVGNFNYESNA